MKAWLQALALCAVAVMVFVGAPIGGSIFGMILGIGLALLVLKYIFEEYNNESTAERGAGSDEKSTR